jgi:hypothetical protein
MPIPGIAGCAGAFGTLARSNSPIHRHAEERPKAGLNKSEQRHTLTQAIDTFRQGRIIDRSHEAQQAIPGFRPEPRDRAIVYWNPTYLADAVAHLRSGGEIVPDDLLVHTSPVGWEHIAFSGDFLWIEPQRRPLGQRSICR